eukprot:9372520-Heterocapsa_arctica.AAC.1
MSGNCNKGDKCHYKHDVQELAADVAQLQIDCDTMNTLFIRSGSVEDWPAEAQDFLDHPYKPIRESQKGPSKR